MMNKRNWTGVVMVNELRIEIAGKSGTLSGANTLWMNRVDTVKRLGIHTVSRAEITVQIKRTIIYNKYDLRLLKHFQDGIANCVLGRLFTPVFKIYSRTAIPTSVSVSWFTNVMTAWHCEVVKLRSAIRYTKLFDINLQKYSMEIEDYASSNRWSRRTTAIGVESVETQGRSWRLKWPLTKVTCWALWIRPYISQHFLPVPFSVDDHEVFHRPLTT